MTDLHNGHKFLEALYTSGTHCQRQGFAVIIVGNMKIELNPGITIEAKRITNSFACVVVDDFLLNPDELVEYAREHRDNFIQQERAYPGLILPVEIELLSVIKRFVRLEMSRCFGFLRGDIKLDAQLALTTLIPDELSWIQRLCHTDPRLAPERRNFASVLYLFDQPDLGGTGFYRWKDTEFWEKMSAMQIQDPDAGLEILQERFQMFRDPPCYITESNAAAELLDMAPARFNRLIFYPGDLPHSAYINKPELLSSDPVKGRLTLNCFVSALLK